MGNLGTPFGLQFRVSSLQTQNLTHCWEFINSGTSRTTDPFMSHARTMRICQYSALTPDTSFESRAFDEGQLMDGVSRFPSFKERLGKTGRFHRPFGGGERRR